MNNILLLCLLFPYNNIFFPSFASAHMAAKPFALVISIHKGNSSGSLTQRTPVTSAMWKHSRLLVEMQPGQNETRVEG